jgi:hypothetical protein
LKLAPKSKLQVGFWCTSHIFEEPYVWNNTICKIGKFGILQKGRGITYAICEEDANN